VYTHEPVSSDKWANSFLVAGTEGGNMAAFKALRNGSFRGVRGRSDVDVPQRLGRVLQEEENCGVLHLEGPRLVFGKQLGFKPIGN